MINAGDLKAVTLGNLQVKFADDIYLVVPAKYINSWIDELENIGTWAQKNNLTLNRTKSAEIVFVDKMRRRQAVPPPTLSGIERVESLKVLGVTVTNNLSASDHIRGVITNCASFTRTRHV